ncbi:MAG TPA: lysine--tRNA ligase [Solirubrobacteraceae bacterium]|jgi:lysyl-tRNA synthetase class 2
MGLQIDSTKDGGAEEELAQPKAAAKQAIEGEPVDAASPGEGEPVDGASPGAEEGIGSDERLAKAQRLQAEGIAPFAHVDMLGRDSSAAILAAHDPSQLEHGEHPELPCKLAGRIVSRRGHGKKSFLDLRDNSGEIQIYAAEDSLGEQPYARLLELDIGDIVAIEGCLYVTQRGQLAVSVHRFTLLTKALRTPPSRYHGVGDAGTRHRFRELDLMANKEARELFRVRNRTIEALRAWLGEHRFIEVETPVLQTLAGGASARPFVTHHNALDIDLSLRISVELYLNRCLIGGMENVYDLGKCFRNEGISYRHSPEFTMLEWLQSYSDYNDVARLTEEMVAGVAQEVLGTTIVERSGQSLDLSVWRRTTMQEVVLQETGLDIMDSDAASLIALLKERGERIHPESSWAHAVHTIYSKLVEHTLVQPTLVFDFPVEQFPITKRHAEHRELAEHFDAVIGGIELVSGDSEVTDPVEQRERFVEQRRGRGEEADEAHPHDEEYVRSLEYGLAPSASGGMGVDRLLMILTGYETLREVLAFPTMRERQQGQQ